jgi:Icc protein
MNSEFSMVEERLGDVVRILQITDFHIRSQPDETLLGVNPQQSFEATLAAALAETTEPDLALLTGDLAQDASASTYERLREGLASLPCSGYCLPGNHDDPSLMASVLARPPIHYQSHILMKGWQIICLDSTIRHSPYGKLADDQLALLEQYLVEYPDHFALVALHHHPVASGSAWMDTMQLENADAFFDLLDRHSQARGVVFGHIHQTLESEYRGLRILGTPSTCFQFKPGQAQFALDALPPGYRWIELHPDGHITTQVQRLNTIPSGLDVESGGY